MHDFKPFFTLKIFKFLVVTTILVYFFFILNIFSKFIYYHGYKQPPKEYIGYFIDSNLYLKNLLFSKIDYKDGNLSNLRSIYLELESRNINDVLKDIPESIYKKKYYNATLIYPDGIKRKIKFRIRGRNNWHWQYNKPSLRLKLNKKNTINLNRHLELINPEDKLMLANPFGEELSRKFGILANKTEFVNVFINNKYYGLYHLIERLDESFLRNNNKMPAPIYTGDRLGIKWDINDFDLESNNGIIKEFHFINRKNLKDSIEIYNPLNNVIKVLNTENSETNKTKKELFEISKKNINKLWKVLDKEKLASYSALMAVTSNTHTDFHHNQAFFFNISSGKIEPIAVDMNILGMLLKPGGKWRFINRERLREDIYSKKNHISYFSLPLYEKITPILNLAFMDSSFVYLRNKIIYDALQTFASTQNQHDLIDSLISPIYNSILNDKNKGYVESTFSGPFRFPYSNYQFKKEISNAKKFIKNRNDYLIKQLDNNELHIEPSDVTEKDVIFEVTILTNSSISFDLGESFDPKQFKIFVDNQFKPFDSQKILLYPKLIRSVDEELHQNTFKTYLIGRRWPNHSLKSGYNTFKFKTSLKNFNYLISNKEKFFNNSLNNKNVKFLNSKPKYQSNKIHTITQSFKFVKKVKEIVLGPDIVEIDKNLIFDEETHVRILPGTIINFNGNFSIISKGKIHIGGTKINPIIFKSTKKKWGTLGILGQSANGSVIKNTIFQNGTFSNLNNISLTGMISIYNVDDIKIMDTIIQNNHYGDDALRTINSNIHLNNVKLKNCYKDCIDLDYSKAIIENINIYNAGNDSLDFMSSEVKINSVNINNCGDKGISIGEASNVNGKNIIISNCKIGIASKDDSLGTFDTIVLKSNNIGLAKYLKNWRYRFPGNIIINNSIFEKNKINQFFEKEKIIKELDL